MMASTSGHRLFQFLSERTRRLSYIALGPTTVHLRYEGYLLLCLTLLTVSSLKGLYRESFGTTGDLGYLLLTSLWLGRHLIIRWLCSWDTSTSTHPSITGFLSHFLTAHCTGGQTFDRPSVALVAKQIGTPTPRDDNSVYLEALLPSSLLYLIQIPWVWIGIPLLDVLQAQKPRQSSSFAAGHYDYRRRSASHNRDNRRGEQPSQGSIQRGLQSTLQYTSSVWKSYGPSLQFLITVLTLAYYMYNLFILYAQPPEAATHGMMATSASNSQILKTVLEETQPYGAYQKTQRPDFSQVLFYFSTLGTVVSIVVYGRVALPIPDQVACANVIKDVRHEARTKSSSKTTKGSGSSGSSGKDSADAVWTERFQPIAYNRVKLTAHVAAIRLLDNVFICGVLPRTGYACRATGHCPAGAQIWQLSKVLYPAGITTSLRKDGVYGTAFSLLVPDPLSALWTVFGVVMVTGVLLLAQTISLNRSYLSTLGYICADEWTLVTSAERPRLTSTPTTWDPRRKYKKGDLILYPPGNRRPSVYRATSHSPEGRPYGKYLQLVHRVLRKELGYAGTSELLLKASLAQLTYVLLNAALWIGLRLMGYPAYGLLVALAANLVSTYAVLDVGGIRRNELEQLNAEIAASH